MRRDIMLEKAYQLLKPTLRVSATFNRRESKANAQLQEIGCGLTPANGDADYEKRFPNISEVRSRAKNLK